VHDCTGSFYHHAAFSLRIRKSLQWTYRPLGSALTPAGGDITSRSHS
jgi:hypothetical protein